MIDITGYEPPPLKVFTCNDHDSVYVGGASVILARDEQQARELLDAALVKANLRPGTGTLIELDSTEPQAVVLLDGDY